MYKVVYIYIMFLLFPLSASCQAKDMEVEMHTQGSTFSHEFTPYEICFDFKYNLLKRLYVKCDYERTEAFALHAQVDQLCLLFILDLVEFDLILALG